MHTFIKLKIEAIEAIEKLRSAAIVFTVYLILLLIVLSSDSFAASASGREVKSGHLKAIEIKQIAEMAGHVANLDLALAKPLTAEQRYYIHHATTTMPPDERYFVEKVARLNSSFLREVIQGIGNGKKPFVSPNRKLVALVKDNSRELAIYEVSSGIELSNIVSPAPIINMAYSADSQSMLITGKEGYATLWHCKSEEGALSLVQFHLGSSRDATAGAISSRGDTILIVTEDGLSTLWTANGHLIQAYRVAGQISRPSLVAFNSLNNDFAAILFGRSEVRLINVRTGHELEVIQLEGAHTRPIEGLAFGSNGEYIITTSRDNTLVTELKR
jgi:WD40 repeat protein